MKISEIIAAIETVAPLRLQESYDNSGLQTGHPDHEATGAVLCVDATEEILLEAERKGCNLVISHHPLLFHGVKCVSGRNRPERVLEMAIRMGITIYSSHTAMDSSPAGISRRMAAMLGLRDVEVLVLDEADRMLDMGFIHDVTRILDKIPNRKNLGMFSATISREVMDISWVYQRDPEEITVQATKENKPDILQYRIEVPSDQKVDTIARIITGEKLERVMCFCNTKGSTERLTKFLQMRGLDAQCIHGDIPQRKREAVMALFREGKLRVFVATDVAARGIDVDDVDAVFNYDVPDENEYYIHRIGRTGRAKRHGVAYTLLSDFPSRMRLDDIARNTRSQIISAAVDENGHVEPEKK